MPRPGDQIGPYKLILPIGAGAMGEVWRARDERLQRHVALKILPPDAGGCVVDPARPDLAPPSPGPPPGDAYTLAPDFYASYYLPFYATWAVCERATLLAQQGDRAGAAALLRSVATRAPNRHWLTAALRRYE